MFSSNTPRSALIWECSPRRPSFHRSQQCHNTSYLHYNTEPVTLASHLRSPKVHHPHPTHRISKTRAVPTERRARTLHCQRVAGSRHAWFLFSAPRPGDVTDSLPRLASPDSLPRLASPDSPPRLASPDSLPRLASLLSHCRSENMLSLSTIVLS